MLHRDGDSSELSGLLYSATMSLAYDRFGEHEGDAQ